MAVTPTSPEALHTSYLVNLLANSAALRTAVVAADATAALSKIVVHWGGRPKDTAASAKAKTADGTTIALPSAHAVLRLGPYDAEEDAWRSVVRSTEAHALVYWSRNASHSPYELLLDGLNRLGDMATQIRNLLGSASTYPAHGTVQVAGPPEVPDPSEEGAGWDSYVRGVITLDTRGV